MPRDQSHLLSSSSGVNSDVSTAPQPTTRFEESVHPMKITETQMTGAQSQDTERKANVCAGCGMVIWDRTMLSAMEQNWHNHCLKCHCCGGRLAEMGTSLFHRGNMLLCRQDYLKLFGVAGICSACQTAIPPDEMVMRCNSSVYHLKCFTCAHCHSPLLPGERYLLVNGSPFCEHEFGRLLQGTPPPPPPPPTQPPQVSSSSANIPLPVMTPPIFAQGGLESPVFCGNQETPSHSTSGRVTPRQRKSKKRRLNVLVKLARATTKPESEEGRERGIKV
ncbi:LIM domain transcription factor [Echinococcus granulosus]|uniref:LIM domain transcription factor n=1 Tax=Echinococcus granulosus TaxID=6210 RepID=W6UZW2_ECHGR|nr:LIM domain transcription factor [Echinococcus granulosus]EUB59219.1 LIM domain transcription factor [Echinococcus granulosus]